MCASSASPFTYDLLPLWPGPAHPCSSCWAFSLVSSLAARRWVGWPLARAPGWGGVFKHREGAGSSEGGSASSEEPGACRGASLGPHPACSRLLRAPGLHRPEVAERPHTGTDRPLCAALGHVCSSPAEEGVSFQAKEASGSHASLSLLGVSYCSWSVQLSRDQPTTRPSGAPVDTAASHSLPKSPLVKCSSRAPHLVPRTTYASHTNQGGAPSPAGGGPATQNAHVQQVH